MAVLLVARMAASMRRWTVSSSIVADGRVGKSKDVVEEAEGEFAGLRVRESARMRACGCGKRGA